MSFELVTAAQRPELLQTERELNDRIWPEFMFHDSVSNKWFSKLYVIFPEFQFWLIKKEQIVGIGNTIPLAVNKEIEDLPEEGWDWAIEKGFQDFYDKKDVNTLCGLLIAVAPEFQGKGISRKIISNMLEKAVNLGLKRLIIPVRPSWKSRFPLIEMEKYITWKREDGQPFDPWLRVHQKSGGQLVKICHHAMTIKGTVDAWSQWTGQEFPVSGSYIIPGALVPVQINIEKNTGAYIEPNVWISYKIN
jgi:GNAT superfamily N-acetyltransferase